MSGQRFLRTISYSDNVIQKLDALEAETESAIDMSLVETLVGGRLYPAIINYGSEVLPNGKLGAWYIIQTDIAVFALVTLDDREDVLVCTYFAVRAEPRDIFRRPLKTPQ